MADHAMPPAEVCEAISATATDLAEVTKNWPIPGDRAEMAARIMDRLSEECARYAAWFRRSQLRAVDAPSAARVWGMPARRVPPDPPGLHRVPADRGHAP